ncbi:hypothetical protein [Candidatus Poriferisodalis sp.]|uniref:hypothetical protein n=1 Tax=Candidatus Poriferisodalis sp. TaxID=3101277 RepID=UPI003B02764A
MRLQPAELERVRSAALVAGETVATFVRDALHEKCRTIEGQRPDVAGAVRSSDGKSAPQLGRVERLVLAAIVSLPGLRSVATVAAAAGVSWSAARGALDSLSAHGAVRFRTWKQSWRHGVREIGAWEPEVASENSAGLLAQTACVSLPPQPPPSEHSGPLPPQLWHLFWDHPDPSVLKVPDDADYVANRLLNGPSASAALWAAVHLPADALRASTELRSSRPETRDLVKNVLASRDAALR